jgi:hypothetical protein
MCSSPRINLSGWKSLSSAVTRALLDDALQAVNLGVGGDHALAEPGVAPHQRVDRFDDHAFDQAAHFRNQPGQFLQIAVECLCGMFRSHIVLPSRTGR